MPNIKTEDIRSIVSAIDTYATELGLMPSGARIQYYKGNQANGISATLEVTRNEGTPQRESIRDDFLPTFTYKTSREQQYRELTATYKVLLALFRIKMADHGRPEIAIHPSIG